MRGRFEALGIDRRESGEVVEDAGELSRETRDIGLAQLDKSEARDVEDISGSEGHEERLQRVLLYRRVWRLGMPVLRSVAGVI